MMRALVILLIHGLAVAQAISLFGGSEEVRPGNDIKALCTNQRIDLTTRNELEDLAKGAGDEVTCLSHVVWALRQLRDLIREGSSDLCSPESVEKFTKFYNKYLSTHGLTGYSSQELLPKPLRRFVIAYGMQMSNLCRRNTVLVLSQMSQSKLLNEDDLDVIKTLAGNDGPIATMLGDLASPGEVFLPSDMAPFLKSSGLRTKKLGADKLYLQTSTGSSIRYLQMVCERRLEPIYGPLLMPIVRLSNMGFNYKDDFTRSLLKSERSKIEVAPWSRIVFVCEALKGIHLVEDAENKVKSGSNEDPRLVRIITEEEAWLIESGGKKLERLGHEEVDDNEVTSELARVVYEPSTTVNLGNVIYTYDERFDKAVRGFKTSRGERSVIKRRLLKKGFSMIKSEIKRGHVGLLISAGFKGIAQRVKGDKVPETREEFITTLNELIRREDNEDLGEVTYKLGHAQTFVMSVALVALLVGICMSFLVGYFTLTG